MLVRWLMYAKDMMYRWRVWLRGEAVEPADVHSSLWWLHTSSLGPGLHWSWPLVQQQRYFPSNQIPSFLSMWPHFPGPQLLLHGIECVNSEDPRGLAICTSGKKSPSQSDFSFWFPLPRGQKGNSALGQGLLWALMRDRGQPPSTKDALPSPADNIPVAPEILLGDISPMADLGTRLLFNA